MDSEGSLPHLQEPATGHYPDQDKFSPHPHIQFLMYILIPFSHAHQCFPGGHFSSDFHTKSLYVFIISSMEVTYPSCLILLQLITLIINCTISINIGLIFSFKYFNHKVKVSQIISGNSWHVTTPSFAYGTSSTIEWIKYTILWTRQDKCLSRKIILGGRINFFKHFTEVCTSINIRKVYINVKAVPTGIFHWYLQLQKYWSVTWTCNW